MHKVFIYETLKRRRILEEALGEDHGKKMTPAVAPGLGKTVVVDGKHLWPTIKGANQQVKGDIIEVTDQELKSLDDWEERYQRKDISTSEGQAWAYIYNLGWRKNRDNRD